MRRTTAAVAALFSILCGTTYADQLQFTGHTSTSDLLMRDALLAVWAVVKGRYHCATMDSVESEVMPPQYEPVGGKPPGATTVVYERWTVALCGRKVPFLLAFWPSAVGGTTYEVVDPFPAAKP